jgi:hypothetical protein
MNRPDYNLCCYTGALPRRGWRYQSPMVEKQQLKNCAAWDPRRQKNVKGKRQGVIRSVVDFGWEMDRDRGGSRDRSEYPRPV